MVAEKFSHLVQVIAIGIIRVTTNLPAPSERLVVGTIDEHTANFTGSKTDTIYDASIDALFTVTIMQQFSGEYIFANSIDLTQKYDVNSRKVLKASNFVLNSLWDSRTDLIDTWGYIDAVGGLTELQNVMLLFM